MTDFDRGNPRLYYERQGREARSTGAGIQCSEPSVTEVVLRMLAEHSHRFTSILDVGCGANLTYDLPLSQRGKKVTGVEFARAFLELAPPHPGISLVQADATRLPFRTACFDAVVCSETVEHVPDDEGVISEIARVLKPGALFFFTVPNLWNAARLIGMVRTLSPRVTLMEGHLREYSPAQVRRLLASRFRVVREYPVGFGWTGPRGRLVDRAVRSGALARLSKSIAVVAERSA